MRPQGEVRSAIVAAIRGRGPMALRDAAHGAQVGYGVAKVALSRCVAAGQLVVAGQERREHSKNWVRLYDVPEPAPAEVPTERHGCGWVDLGEVMQVWGR